MRADVLLARGPDTLYALLPKPRSHPLLRVPNPPALLWCPEPFWRTRGCVLHWLRCRWRYLLMVSFSFCYYI